MKPSHAHRETEDWPPAMSLREAALLLGGLVFVLLLLVLWLGQPT